MTLKNGDRFTIYDAMEASGVFLRNPANAGARDDAGRQLYSGPVQFPMMVYHPKGRERVLVPGTSERTSYGTVEKFGEQWEIINREVADEVELAQALAEGWHKHPAIAIKAANETWRAAEGVAPLPVPPISAGSRIADLEEQNRKLTELLAQAKRDEAEVAAVAAPFVPPMKGASAVAKAGLV